MGFRSGRQSEKWIVSLQYFVYFGIMGIYLPYFNLYCFHLGFSGFQIGILSAARSLVLIVLPLVWSWLADRFQVRKSLYIACNMLSTAIWAFFLFTVDFGFMLVITIAYGIFYAPIISFLEAFSMDVLGRHKKSYGRIRVWGSVSFILVVMLAGKMIDLFSIKIIVAGILAGSFLLAVMSVKLPESQTVSKRPLIAGAKSLLNRQVLVFLASAFLMLVSHGTYYGFFSIHLESLGYGNTFIGVSWALAVVAEILVMLASRRVLKRYALERVLAFSFAAAVLRWLALFWFKSPAVIILSQGLHAFSYGTFHIASILYIDRASPEAAKTIGQAINNAVSYGLGLMVGFFISGLLYERLGSFALFGLSSLIALSGGILLTGSQWFGRWEKPASEPNVIPR